MGWRRQAELPTQVQATPTTQVQRQVKLPAQVRQPVPRVHRPFLRARAALPELM
jgi:hypothetical protein